MFYSLYHGNFIVSDEPFQPSPNEAEPISGPTLKFNTTPSGHQYHEDNPELILSVKRIQEKEKPAKLIHVKPIKPELN